MKKIALVIAVFVLGGCSAAQLAQFQVTWTKDVTAIEIWVAKTVAKIKAAAPVVYADAKQAVDLTCGILVPGGQSAVATLQGTIDSPPAKVQSALSASAKYLATAQAACAKYQQTLAANPTGVDPANTAIAAWNGYAAAQQQIAAAKVAEGQK